MPISLSVLCSQIDPAKTTLLLGAGSTIPSGGLSGAALAEYLANEYKALDLGGYTLAETASLVERRAGRKELVRSLQKKIAPVKASGAILTIPDFPWRSLYTTNYDTALEQAYQAVGSKLCVYSSNFDFTVHDGAVAAKLYKFHGTIERDRSVDGGPSSMIITEDDYDTARDYREMIYKTLATEMDLGPLVVIGNTLAESDLKNLLQETIDLKRKSGGNGRIVLLLYTKDEHRASLFEAKGIDVCFGGLDDFVSEMLKAYSPDAPSRRDGAGLFNDSEILHVEAVSVQHGMDAFSANVHRMFNGSAATFADIVGGMCFDRDVTGQAQSALEAEDKLACLILGASGVGKTTLSRMISTGLVTQGWHCWEHKGEFTLHTEECGSRSKEISDLVENAFHGYSIPERRRRLTERCGADMFVCLKNIFSSDSFDDIILEEYADLDDDARELFRTVSAMEASGVQLHRQIISRTLGIPADSIVGMLARLDEIITEHTIDKKEGIFRWQGRHPVISGIIMSYKFNDDDEYATLLERIIDNLVVTKNIEVRSLREMCDMTTGVGRIKSAEKQNYLFRRMITLAPSERVPRHRLIRNLIEDGKYPEAGSEIRIFERDLGIDAPIARYKALLLLRRAQNVGTLLKEDKLKILGDALALSREGVRRFQDDKSQHDVHLNIGYELLILSGDWKPFDDALEFAKKAEERALDPDIGRTITRFENLAMRFQSGT